MITSRLFKRRASWGPSSLVNVISTLDVSLLNSLSWMQARGVGGLADSDLNKTFPVHPDCTFRFTGFVQQHPHDMIQVNMMWYSNGRSAPLYTQEVQPQI